MIKHTILALVLGAISLAQADVIVNFEDLPLSPGSYHNNSAFQSFGAGFNNFYDAGFWSGFAYSNTTDRTTPGYGNQYSAVAVSTGTYGVGFMDAFNNINPTIALPLGNTQPISISITNTAYTYYSIKDGDSFTEPFGEGDWFMLTIEGKNSANASIGTIDFYLADYRSSNSADWYILNTWSAVDLTSLGSNVASLVFTLTSSDTGAFGINTPAYFAMDNLVLVPEPSSVMLLGAGLVVVLWLAGRRFRRATL